MQQRIQLIQQALNHLQPKMNNYQHWKISIDHKLLAYDSKLTILSQQSTHTTQKYQSKFEEMVSKSDKIKQYLQQCDSNSIHNLKMLEEQLRGGIDDIYRIQSSLEAKMLALFHQKQQLLQQLHYQMESQLNKIKILEEWVTNQADKSAKLRHQRFIEEVNHKVQLMQDQINNHQHQIDKHVSQVDSKFKHPDNKAINNISQLTQDINANTSNITQLKMQLQQINSKLSDQGLSRRKPSEDKLLTDTEINRINKQLSQCKDQIKMVDSKLNSIDDQVNTIEERLNAMEESNYHHTKKISESNSKNIDDHMENNKRKSLLDRGLSTITKKYQQQSVEHSQSSMRGGIKGLLKRSHQKQSKNINKSPPPSTLKPLKPPPKKNPLPPMKYSNMKQPQNIYQQDQQSEEQVYQCDEEGFLIDSQGNYIVNEYGERLRISQQELDQILHQQNQHY